MVATVGGNQWWPYRGARAPQLTFLEGFSSLYRVRICYLLFWCCNFFIIYSDVLILFVKVLLIFKAFRLLQLKHLLVNLNIISFTYCISV